MHLELVELLRCPVPHRESVLVAATQTVQSRFIVDGLLGCPECGAEYGIKHGVAHFDRGFVAAQALAPIPASHDPVDPVDQFGPIDTDAVTRVAAQLSVSEGRQVFALFGHSLTFAMTLRMLVSARVIVINAPASKSDALEFAKPSTAPAGIVQCDEILPLVDRKFSGIAIADGARASANDETIETLVTRAAFAVRTGGRLVAPARTAIPTDFRELARDELVWVAERTGITSAPVELRRR